MLCLQFLDGRKKGVLGEECVTEYVAEEGLVVKRCPFCSWGHMSPPVA